MKSIILAKSLCIYYVKQYSTALNIKFYLQSETAITHCYFTFFEHYKHKDGKNPCPQDTAILKKDTGEYEGFIGLVAARMQNPYIKNIQFQLGYH